MDTQQLIDSVINDWWYYSVELAPGVITKGADTPDTPMLPRMMMREADLRGMSCLDIGSMEGLIPAMMVRKGAASVLASDAIPHCQKKMDVLKRVYDVDFDFQQIGLVYDLSQKLASRGGFDFINLSGVLYHVFSPMHALAGIRPLLKKNGLMLVSTNVILRGDQSLVFNHQGSLQTEINTFWYHSVPMLEYLLRLVKLAPIDFMFFPHSPVNPKAHVPGVRSGYLSVMCRAVDDPQNAYPDQWAARMRAQSWEHIGLCNEAMLQAQPVSTIGYSARGSTEPRGISLYDAIDEPHRVVRSVDDAANSQMLHLADRS